MSIDTEHSENPIEHKAEARAREFLAAVSAALDAGSNDTAKVALVEQIVRVADVALSGQIPPCDHGEPLQILINASHDAGLKWSIGAALNGNAGAEPRRRRKRAVS